MPVLGQGRVFRKDSTSVCLVPLATKANRRDLTFWLFRCLAQVSFFWSQKLFAQLLVLGPLGQVSVQFLSPCWGPLAGGVPRAPRTPIGSLRVFPLVPPFVLCSPQFFGALTGPTRTQETKGPTRLSVDSLHAPLGQEKNAHQIVEERRQRKSSFDPMQVQ